MSTLLHSLFHLMEEDKYDKKINKLLHDTVKKVIKQSDNIYEVDFKNGIKIVITYSFDHYYFFISDPTFYEYGETPYTQMSNDRVIHYIQQIGNYLYER